MKRSIALTMTFFLLGIAFQSGRAQCPSFGQSLYDYAPANPTDQDVINIKVRYEFRNGCEGLDLSLCDVQILGQSIYLIYDIFCTGDPICTFPVWCEEYEYSVGPLAPGQYNVFIVDQNASNDACRGLTHNFGSFPLTIEGSHTSCSDLTEIFCHPTVYAHFLEMYRHQPCTDQSDSTFLEIKIYDYKGDEVIVLQETTLLSQFPWELSTQDFFTCEGKYMGSCMPGGGFAGGTCTVDSLESDTLFLRTLWSCGDPLPSCSNCDIDVEELRCQEWILNEIAQIDCSEDCPQHLALYQYEGGDVIVIYRGGGCFPLLDLPRYDVYNCDGVFLFNIDYNPESGDFTNRQVIWECERHTPICHLCPPEDSLSCASWIVKSHDAPLGVLYNEREKVVIFVGFAAGGGEYYQFFTCLGEVIEACPKNDINNPQDNCSDYYLSIVRGAAQIWDGVTSVIPCDCPDIPLVFTQSLSICKNESVRVGMRVYDKSGRYVDTLAHHITGCDSVVVTNLTVATEYFESEGIVLCHGESVVISGKTYNMPVAVYDTIFSTTSCDTILEYEIEVLPKNENSIPIDTMACFGETLLLGGRTVTMDGQYPDTLLASDGCDSLITYNVRFLPEYKSLGQIILCHGESWRSPSGDIYFPRRDTVVIDHLRRGRCDSIVTTEIQVSSPTSSDTSIFLCPGERVVVNGETFGSSQGNFTTTTTNQWGCDSVIRIVIVHYPQPDVDIQGVDTIRCGDTIRLSATDDLDWTYEWSAQDGNILGNPASSSIQVNAAGTYALITTNDDGCFDVDTFVVGGNTPRFSSLLVDSTFCYGDSSGRIFIEDVQGGSPPYAYALDNQIFSNEDLFSNLPAGTYTIKVRDSDDCQIEKKVKILEPLPLQIALMGWPTSEVSRGSMHPLLAEAPLAQRPMVFSWSLGDTLGLSCTDCGDPVLTVLRSGTYRLEMTDARGCMASSSWKLQMENEAPGDVISPNNDGINDHLVFPELELNPQLYKDAQLTIVNRWGQIVYTDDHYKNDWNGVNQSGHPLPEGTYYYQMALDVLKGNIQKGNVLILR